MTSSKMEALLIYSKAVDTIQKLLSLGRPIQKPLIWNKIKTKIIL